MIVLLIIAFVIGIIMVIVGVLQYMAASLFDRSTDYKAVALFWGGIGVLGFTIYAAVQFGRSLS